MTAELIFCRTSTAASWAGFAFSVRRGVSYQRQRRGQQMLSKNQAESTFWTVGIYRKSEPLKCRRIAFAQRCSRRSFHPGVQSAAARCNALVERRFCKSFASLLKPWTIAFCHIVVAPRCKRCGKMLPANRKYRKDAGIL